MQDNPIELSNYLTAYLFTIWGLINTNDLSKALAYIALAFLSFFLTMSIWPKSTSEPRWFKIRTILRGREMRNKRTKEQQIAFINEKLEDAVTTCIEDLLADGEITQEEHDEVYSRCVLKLGLAGLTPQSVLKPVHVPQIDGRGSIKSSIVEAADRAEERSSTRSVLSPNKEYVPSWKRSKAI